MAFASKLEKERLRGMMLRSAVVNLLRIALIPGSLVAAVAMLWYIFRNIPDSVGLFIW